MTRNRFYAIVTASLILVAITFAKEKPAVLSIVGQVFSRQTKEPIPSANVVILGSTIGAATDGNGRFAITNVATGQHELQVTVLGYKTLTQIVSIDSCAVAPEQSIALEEENITVGVVEVTASQFAPALDQPVSTRSFSVAELKNTAGGLDDVVRTVRSLPGVAQTRADRTELVVRGGAPSENLTLVDNIEVPYISHFSTQGAGGGATAVIDMDLLRSSSFSTGGFGVRYSDKLSSVLSIGTRDGKNDAMHSKANISATQFGLNGEGPLTQDGSFLFSVRKSFLDLVFKAYGFGFAPQYTDFLGKISYALGKDDRLTVLAIGSTDKMDLFNDTEDHRYQNAGIMFSNQNHFVAGSTWRHLLSNGYTTLTLRYARSSFGYFQHTVNLESSFEGSSTECESSIRAEMVLQYDPTTELSFGTEAKAVNVHNFIDPKWGGYTVIDHSLEGAPGKAGIYAQVSKHVSELTLTFGLRGDYSSLINEKFVLAPRFASTLNLTPATSLALSVGRFYQNPSYLWLAGNEMNRNLSRSCGPISLCSAFIISQPRTLR